ncbi:MAG: GTP 3',8-cyclase MoaA [Bdellovibrionales bacterium]|nr:GTP 3',8-cyclase MoaA [Bdellovibrionales bacterium]
MIKLIDDHGRKIRKLRVSLTDKCNLRCHYCMPVNQTFMDEGKYLSVNEISEVVGELVGLGVEEIRLTGGEPLMRKSFVEIVQKLGALKIKKMALTTNGILLDKYLEVLKANRIFHLNVSLDSLDQENFKKITFGNYLSKVVSNIKLAQQAGFIVKINTVLMKGVNDHEILDFIKFSEETGVEVRFLELMRIGFSCGEQNTQFMSAREAIEVIKPKMELKPISSPLDSTSFNFLTSNGAQIGFIASESQPFCGQCSRWRLSADGILRACLLKEDGKNIRALSSDERMEMYRALLGMKPAMRPAEVSHHMNAIGG